MVFASLDFRQWDSKWMSVPMNPNCSFDKQRTNWHWWAKKSLSLLVVALVIEHWLMILVQTPCCWISIWRHSADIFWVTPKNRTSYNIPIETVIRQLLGQLSHMMRSKFVEWYFVKKCLTDNVVRCFYPIFSSIYGCLAACSRLAFMSCIMNNEVVSKEREKYKGKIVISEL